MEIRNKKALFDYTVLKEYTCGIELLGTEIKSIRKGSVDLKDSYVIIKNGECYALNIYIAKYEQGNIFNHDERRTRKLLLHRAEIKKLYKLREEDGISIIPLSMFISNNYAKLKIGVCKGKKLYDKRQAIKEKDFEKMSRYN